MAILKLPNEGDTHIGTVTACREVKGKYGVQVQFTFDTGDDLYIGAETAARQLIRAGFDAGTVPPKADYEAVEGNTLRFSRDHNSNAPDKPYWGITLADAVDKASAKAPPSKRVTPPDAKSQAVAAALDLPAAKGSWADMVSSYRETWALVAGIQGKDATADSIQAGVATLLIQADKRNIAVPSAVAPKPKPTAKLPDPADDESDDSMPF